MESSSLKNKQTNKQTKVLHLNEIFSGFNIDWEQLTAWKLSQTN